MFLRASTLLKKKKKKKTKKEERKKQENYMCCAFFFPHGIISLNCYVLELVAMAVRVYFIQSLVLFSVHLNYGT